MKLFASNRYTRPVSVAERYNLAFNEIHYYNAEYIVEGEGYLDLEQWRTALKLVGEANPGCRVRYKSFLKFAKWVDSGIAPEVNEISGGDWNGRSSAGAEFLQKKFNPLEGGPVCDVLIVNGSPARAVFRSCHGALDGRGIIHIGHETLRALRGEPLLGSNSNITDTDIRYEYRKKGSAPTVSAPEKIIPVVPCATPKNEDLSYLWRRFTIPKQVNHLLTKMAIFLADYAHSFNSGSIIFIVPVDYRNLRTEEVSIGNLTGNIIIDVTTEDTSNKIMRRINQQIKNHEDCFYPPKFKAQLWKPISGIIANLKKDIQKDLHTANNKVPTGGIVSLGHVNTKDWSYDKFKACTFFAIPAAIGRLNVIIQTYTDSAEITICAPTGYNHEGQLDKMISACIDHFGQ